MHSDGWWGGFHPPPPGFTSVPAAGLISHNVEVQPSWDVLWFVKSMRRKQKQTRRRSDEDWNRGWMKVQNDEESSSGQEKPRGGARKGSNQRNLSPVEICWGLKLHFLKVTFIFHGAWCCILRGRFSFGFLEGSRRSSVHLGGFPQPTLPFWYNCSSLASLLPSFSV